MKEISITIMRSYVAWFLVGFSILVWVVWVNRFPAEYIIAGIDIVQLIDARNNFWDFLYTRFGGSAWFYFPIYLLDLWGVAWHVQLSFFVGIFLFLSYGSFFIFVRTLLPHVSAFATNALSLFYACNVYTLYIFTSTWGYTSYQILYAFIPILTATYLSLLRGPSWKRASIFLYITLFASISFSNPAFAISLTLYLTILTLSLLLTGWISLRRKTILWLTGAIIFTVLLNAHWILPTATKVKAGLAEVAVSQDLVLGETLRQTSNSFADTVRFLPTHERDAYYPENFPYPDRFNDDNAVDFLLLIAFVPFFIVLIGLFYVRKKNDFSLYIGFFLAFLFVAILVTRIRFPFEYGNAMLFEKVSGMSVLRGWDKNAIYIPFMVTALLALFFGVRMRRHITVALSVLCIFVAFSLAMPFYAGGLQTRLSYALKNQEEKEFRKARYSALIHVPSEYDLAQNIFDQNPGDYRISMLPYSPGSSVGKVNLPQWKLNGLHPARYIYSQEYLETNEHYLPGWDFGADTREELYDPRWIVDLQGLLNVRYILYHGDATISAVRETERSRNYLVSGGFLRPVLELYGYTLYEIRSDLVMPRIYASTSTSNAISFNPDSLPEDAALVRSQTDMLSYTKINAREFIVDVDTFAPDTKTLILNEKHDVLWRAYYKNCEGQIELLSYDNSVLYANAWQIPKHNLCGTVRIVHHSLDLMYRGVRITFGAAAILFCVTVVIFIRKKIYA